MNQTCLARLSEADSEFSLTRLAQCIKECGPNHFDPRGTTPLSYIQTLLVLGEWSASVCYLLERGEAVAALLLATAFYAYGLLGGADNVFVTCLLRLIRTAGMKPVVAGELVGLVRETGVKNDLCVVSEEICIERRSCWCKATR